MIEKFTSWITYDLIGLAEKTRLADVTAFFLSDIIKIIILLFLITHLMSVLRYYLPVEKLRDFLRSHNFFGTDYFLASIFGAITPFCSCSSIPLFIGFLEARIPLGVTFSFLITSPLINEVAIALFVGVFGWKITLVYLASGILIGMIGGAILGKLKLEKYVESYVWKIKSKNNYQKLNKNNLSWKILKNISREARDITKKIVPYILIGVALGALIHGYVPSGFFENYITEGNPFAVPLAVILAVPLYSNASGVIPVIESLVAKGIPLGTALAFMMAVVGISLPEALILKRVIKLPLLLTFFAVVSLGIIIIGYIFNFIF
jgi:uncharacterized membrane protein YraQ (UPF0718 family)